MDTASAARQLWRASLGRGEDSTGWDAAGPWRAMREGRESAVGQLIGHRRAAGSGKARRASAFVARNNDLWRRAVKADQHDRRGSRKRGPLPRWFGSRSAPATLKSLRRRRDARSPPPIRPVRRRSSARPRSREMRAVRSSFQIAPLDRISSKWPSPLSAVRRSESHRAAPCPAYPRLGSPGSPLRLPAL